MQQVAVQTGLGIARKSLRGVRKFAARRPVAAAWGVIGLLLVPLMSDIYLFLVPVAVLGIGEGFNEPGRRTMIAKLAPVKYRSAFASASDGFFILGEALGPLLLGAVFILGGINAVFYAGAIFSLAIVAVISLTIK